MKLLIIIVFIFVLFGFEFGDIDIRWIFFIVLVFSDVDSKGEYFLVIFKNIKVGLKKRKFGRKYFNVVKLWINKNFLLFI